MLPRVSHTHSPWSRGPRSDSVTLPGWVSPRLTGTVDMRPRPFPASALNPDTAGHSCTAGPLTPCPAGLHSVGTPPRARLHPGGHGSPAEVLQALLFSKANWGHPPHTHTGLLVLSPGPGPWEALCPTERCPRKKAEEGRRAVGPGGRERKPRAPPSSRPWGPPVTNVPPARSWPSGPLPLSSTLTGCSSGPPAPLALGPHSRRGWRSRPGPRSPPRPHLLLRGSPGVPEAAPVPRSGG